MKLFQVFSDICYKEYPNETLQSVKEKYAPDIIFVEAPDYIFEGWGYLKDKFIKPTPPEGWLYDDATGTFYDPNYIPPIPIDSQVNTLKAQLKAQTESSTFLEDCIAEMALQVYK